MEMKLCVLDDSKTRSACHIATFLKKEFNFYMIKYVKGNREDLTSAKNLGVKQALGDLILFLNDDTILDKNVIESIISFMKNNKFALGVQPLISSLLKSYFFMFRNLRNICKSKLDFFNKRLQKEIPLKIKL